MADKRFTLAERSSGVLLHPTSLPGPFGAGDLGPEAHRFARLIAAAGQRWWQMLPVCPIGGGNSPYSALSAFAGGPHLLSVELLAQDGLLSAGDIEPPALAPGRARYDQAWWWKELRLRKAFAAFEARRGGEEYARFEEFCGRRSEWLSDYAVFMALRETHGRVPWTSWEADVRSRDQAALSRAWEKHGAEARFHQFLQYQFDRQWGALRERCREAGVGLVGDVPIFVAHDSADVWEHQDLFCLNPDASLAVMAGVPPDYFSKTGQLWGNPLYRWDVLRARGYAWWVQRLRCAFDRFDAVRLDHFIGFQRYWEVPGGAETAERGRWLDGPQDSLFERLKSELGDIEVMAEDLGLITPEVGALRDRWRFPGMRVLQFAFCEAVGERYHQPHSFPRRCVVYTGTHDNDTTAGWFKSLDGKDGVRTAAEAAAERERALEYFGCSPREVHWGAIRAALASVADLAVIPCQDLLGLGSRARMNRPGTVKGNWEWRLKEGALSADIMERLGLMTRTYGRSGAATK